MNEEIEDKRVKCNESVVNKTLARNHIRPLQITLFY